jgi:hypothetical protein
MNYTANGPTALPLAISSWVWYEGTDALREGEAVCYNTDYGTATAKDARRTNHVERPSLTNNRAFAGVAARDYPASSTGQFIEIYVPGSRGVNIALGVDTVIGTGVLTFVAGAAGSHRGRFYSGKYLGRGSAIPRQTVTAVLESSMTGDWSLATDGVTLTVTSTAGLAAGDTVVLVGGEDEGSGKAIVPGKYTIASITSTTVLVLSASAVGATPGAALTCTGYAYTGNPKCQADLLDGDESAGVEFISLPNAGGDNQPYMVGGVSYVCGGVTLAADAECELAQGTLPGEKKAFICLGTLTTNDFVVDLATSGVALARSSEGAIVALAEVNAIDAAADACYLQFNGALWHLMDVAGGATAV